MSLFKNLVELAFEYGNKTTTAIFAVFGLIFAYISVSAIWQLTLFYLNHSGIDVDLGTLILAGILFSFGSFCAAYTFRGLMTRLSLWQQFRNNLVMAEYEAPANLQPVEATYLLEQSWNTNQTDALMAELIIAGVVQRTPTGYLLTKSKVTGLPNYQEAFIRAAFKAKNAILSQELELLPDKTENLAAQIQQRLDDAGLISDRPLSKLGSVVFRITFFVGLFYSGLELNFVITNGWSALSKNIGQTYPIPLIIIVLLWTVLLFDIGFIVSGFGIASTYSSAGAKTWRYVAGFKEFLQEVYSDRFINDGEITVTEKEFKRLYPYAVAFGLNSLSNMPKK